MKAFLKWFKPDPVHRERQPVLLDSVEAARFPDEEKNQQARDAELTFFQSVLEAGNRSAAIRTDLANLALHLHKRKPH